MRPRSALGDLSLQSGYRLAAELLTPTTQALVCASDTLAIGAAKYLQEQGRSEVLVTGLGNNPMLSFLFPNALSLDLGYKGRASRRRVSCSARLSRNSRRWRP